jgi:hypothetical protein
VTWTAVDGWRDYVKTHDDAALRALLHPAIVFESPIVHTPQVGAEIAFSYLSAAGRAVGGPDFRFVGEWRNDTGAVLEFETQIEGIVVNGVDIVTLTDDGQLITHFKVMVRPLKAINLLQRLMSGELAST